VDRETVFEAWAPRGALWSAWVKPVLFAHVEAVSTTEFAPSRPDWLRRDLLRVEPSEASYRTSASDRGLAIVADLPGVEGIALGLALGDLGYRPVPLYTALPAPESTVPMYDLVRFLILGAEELGHKAISPTAPPAFLLDSRRDGRGARAGQFDNRSIVFPTDFPSLDRLRDAGVRTVLLIQSGSDTVRADLADTLAQWQKEGVPTFLLRADAPGPPSSVNLRPNILARLALWLRRASSGRDARGAFGTPVLLGGSGPHAG
jgi:hypothetical protein